MYYYSLKSVACEGSRFLFCQCRIKRFVSVGQTLFSRYNYCALTGTNALRMSPVLKCCLAAYSEASNSITFAARTIDLFFNVPARELKRPKDKTL